MNEINTGLEKGLLRLWMFFVTCVGVVTFICSLANVDFLASLPLLLIQIYFFIEGFFGYIFYWENDFSYAIDSAFSMMLLFGAPTYAFGYGILWVKKGFAQDQ